MKRTQIQLPDWLFAVAHDVAAQKEISLAELVRRGLEYMVAVNPDVAGMSGEWRLPDAYPLDSDDPFVLPDWRAQLHARPLKVAEDRDQYEAEGDNDIM